MGLLASPGPAGALLVGEAEALLDLLPGRDADVDDGLCPNRTGYSWHETVSCTSYPMPVAPGMAKGPCQGNGLTSSRQ